MEQCASHQPSCGPRIGNADTDIQNRFRFSINYELQFGKEFTGIKKFALGGWQANMIAGWQSGKVFSIVSSGAECRQSHRKRWQNSWLQYRAVPQNAGGADRPNTVKDPRLGHHTLSKFFDTSAFALSPLGTIGNTQRNSMFGPHFRDFDLSLFKNFSVTERATIQFRVETFNISNTPNFYIANTTSSNQQFGNAAFGSISATDPNYNPRQFQFVLKALF